MPDFGIFCALRCAVLFKPTSLSVKNSVHAGIRHGRFFGRSDGTFPRTKKRLISAFFAHCGAPSCSSPRPSASKKPLTPGYGMNGFLVGVTGLEPTAFWTRTRRATSCATPRTIDIKNAAAQKLLRFWLGMMESNHHK